MTDQQLHERLEAAGARWRSETALKPPVGELRFRHRPKLARRVTWLISAAAVVVAAAVATIALVAVRSPTPVPTTGSPAGLYGTRWSYSVSDVEGPVQEPLGLPRSSRRLSTMSFSVYLRVLPDGRVDGSDGCNRLQGGVRVHRHELTVAPFSGLVACRGPLEEISRSVDELLRGKLTWRITCNKLVLTGSQGVLKYTAPDGTPANPRCTRR